MFLHTFYILYEVTKSIFIESVYLLFALLAEICVNPILSTSREGDLVLDPFMGSGTTGEVSLKLGRRFFVYGLNPPFCKLSELRLSKIKEVII